MVRCVLDSSTMSLHAEIEQDLRADAVVAQLQHRTLGAVEQRARGRTARSARISRSSTTTPLPSRAIIRIALCSVSWPAWPQHVVEQVDAVHAHQHRLRAPARSPFTSARCSA